MILIARIIEAVAQLPGRPTDAERDRGATATEYALLVAFIAIVIVAGVTLFGSQLNTFFSNVGTSLGIVS